MTLLCIIILCDFPFPQFVLLVIFSFSNMSTAVTIVTSGVQQGVFYVQIQLCLGFFLSKCCTLFSFLLHIMFGPFFCVEQNVGFLDKEQCIELFEELNKYRYCFFIRYYMCYIHTLLLSIHIEQMDYIFFKEFPPTFL